MNFAVFVFLLAFIKTHAFMPLWFGPKESLLAMKGINMVMDGVDYDTCIREWRCKWQSEGSLLACQIAVESVYDDLMEVGAQKVERLVCEECKDFKVLISMSVEEFNSWQKDSFDPEDFFFETLQDIDGITSIEAQTYKKMEMVSTLFDDDD